MRSIRAVGVLAILAAASIVLLSATGARPPINASGAALAEAGGAWFYLFIASLAGGFLFNNLVLGGGAVALVVATLICVR